MPCEAPSSLGPRDAPNARARVEWRHMTATWLIKQEPSGYPFSALVREKRTSWDGVRNAQARLNLRAMKRGDRVLYYHSGGEKAVVGLARVSRVAYADPTDEGGDWVSVEITADRALPRHVTLAEMRQDPALRDMLLLRHPRLSVMPVEPAHAARILELGQLD
jgi:predicted RNA-binding protein with PUA-like domain